MNPCVSASAGTSEIAAWVQAIGSILAIIAAAWIAIWQSRTQHRSAMALYKAEQRHTHAELSKTLLVLAKNSARAMVHFSGLLTDREAVHRMGSGEVYPNLGELRRIDKAIESIPLHSLPDTLVTPTMILSSTVRQFMEKVEMALRFHREMDAAAFEDLFRTLAEMNTSVKQTCEEIAVEAKRVSES